MWFLNLCHPIVLQPLRLLVRYGRKVLLRRSLVLPGSDWFFKNWLIIIEDFDLIKEHLIWQESPERRLLVLPGSDCFLIEDIDLVKEHPIKTFSPARPRVLIYPPSSTTCPPGGKKVKKRSSRHQHSHISWKWKWKEIKPTPTLPLYLESESEKEILLPPTSILMCFLTMLKPISFIRSRSHLHFDIGQDQHTCIWKSWSPIIKIKTWIFLYSA